METAGFAIGGLAVVLLGIVVPILDSAIRKASGRLDDMLSDRDTRMTQNWPEYLEYTSKEKIIRLTKMFLDHFGKPQDAKKVLDEYVEARREAVAKLYLTMTGKIPPKEKFDEWKRMSVLQLIAEQASIGKIETTTKLLEDIKEQKTSVSVRERWKTRVIVGTTVLQVTALILLHVGAKN